MSRNRQRYFIDYSNKGREAVWSDKGKDGKKGKANRCILRSILLPEDFPENSIQGN